MKITDVRTYVLMNSSIFVRVFTDEGITGTGECSPMNCHVTGTLINHTLKPFLIGKNPLEIDKIWHDLFFKTYKMGVQGIQPEAIAGIDIALWDILGKATRLPVHVLLGGAFREKMQLYASIGGGGSMEPRAMVDQVERRIRDGYKAFKIRMDWGSFRQDVNPRKDIDMFRDVKSVLSKDCLLSFDANNGYTVPTAIAQGKKFQEFDIYHFEEPVAQYDYDGLKIVCDALDVPVSAGEHEYTRWQFHDLITKAGVDIIQPDVVKCAGLTEMRRIMVLGEVHGKIIVPHQTQPAIGNLANLHACCATRSCTRPIEFTGQRPYLDLLFHDLPEIRDGWITVPTRPGLGVEMDEDALDELLFTA
nr:mandelate racemase/muconate lactonizing enzyme family protein [Candidatus Sigynarchaeota archaeon]